MHITARKAFAQHRIFDTSSYVVTRDFGTIGLESVMAPEATRKSIVNDIASGQIDRVVSVIEFNPIEGWSKDITDDIRDEVDAHTAVLQAAE